MKDKSAINPICSNSIESTISISFRMEGKESLGKAAFYDHYTLQKHTGFQTKVVSSPDKAINTDVLFDYISSKPNFMKHTPLTSSSIDGGLLYIPGMTRDSYNKQSNSHKVRIEFEKNIIKDALLRGQPILAVCAGSWTLWEAMGGKIKSVADHNYGGGMPRISNKNKITHNKAVHRLELCRDTLPYNIFTNNYEVDLINISVNSHHWMAPDELTTPENIEISARAIKDPEITIKTRQGIKMEPEENITEAFTTIYGAPVMGIQWHPEAYNWNCSANNDLFNHKILTFMAQSGKAYQAKQVLLEELKDKFKPPLEKEDDSLNDLFKNKLKL